MLLLSIESVASMVKFDMRQDLRDDKARLKLFICAHAPLQESGEVLIRSINNGIQRRDGKRICAY